MSRPRLIFALLFLLSLVGLVGNFLFSSPPIRNNAMDKSNWTTHTIGRFLVDLPPQATITATEYEFGMKHPDTLPEEHRPPLLRTKRASRQRL